MSLTLIAVVPKSADATPIPVIEFPELRNLSALDDAALTVPFFLAETFGLSIGERLDFSTAFTNEVWSLAMTGAYLGMPISLSFNGSFDESSDTGIFTSSGTVGGLPWTSSGNWSFTDDPTDPMALLMTWESDVFIGSLDKIDGIVNQKYIYDQVGNTVNYTDTGTIQKTDKDGNPVGAPMKLPDSKGSFPKTPPKKGTQEWGSADSPFALEGAFDLDVGEKTGTVTTVPEPSTLLLLGSGLIGLLSRGRKRHNHK